MTAVLEAHHLAKSFAGRRTLLGRTSVLTPAVRDVSLGLGRSTTLGLVGESGAGKSTVGRMLVRLLRPDSGRIELEGQDITCARGRELRSIRGRIRMIFQDPFASLDPRMVVGESVAEPLKMFEKLRGDTCRDRVVGLLQQVGMEAEHYDRYPFEFSGGQLQRIAVARALVTNPSVIVCDEPVAALDMSIRAQIINLLLDVQCERAVSYVFVSHDLSLVRHVANYTAVMYAGKIVEEGPTHELFNAPMHPYTVRLMAAIPQPNPGGAFDPSTRTEGISDELQATSEVGCAYASRCPHVQATCREKEPELRIVNNLKVACHLYRRDQINIAPLIEHSGRVLKVE